MAAGEGMTEGVQAYLGKHKISSLFEVCGTAGGFRGRIFECLLSEGDFIHLDSLTPVH